MAATLEELLMPQVVLEVISRLKDGRGPLGSWLGFQPTSFDPATVSVKGPNTLTGTGSVRNVSYRIFDHTRVPMKMRAPGTGPGTVAQNPMGVNTVSVARFHQKIPLNYEFLGQLSPMIGPNSQIDEGGRNYIAQQTTFLAEQGNNIVEMLAAGMMRDSLYFIPSYTTTGGSQSENWLPSFTAPTSGPFFQCNFQIPAGNKNQLNMLNTGNIITQPWNNPGAPLLTNIQQIVAAYAQLSRYAMTDIWINSLMWLNVITNTQVRNTAGSSMTPFTEFERVPEKGMADSGPSNKFMAVLRGNPTVKWHFCDDTLALGTDVDPSYGTAPATANLQKLIPDNMAIFCTEPSPKWTRLYLGGEYVVENPGMAGALRMGHYFWHEYVTQPSAVDLICLLNCIPLLYIPLVVAPAIVVF
jgi:hypothetical protein